MKRFLTLLLAVLMVATLFAACGETEKAPEKITSVSEYKSGDGYTELTDPLTWEAINAFPVVNSSMTIDEARKLCVDFFRYAKTAQWIPADNWDFTHHDDGTGPDTLQGGMVYGGLPYVGLATSGIYRVLDYMDPETGVVDIEHAGQFQRQFGNQCAQGAYQGWSRVINSAKYQGTPKMTKINGFLPIGDYTFDGIDTIVGWTGEYGTDEVVRENDPQVMFEAYAQMKPGDGFVYFTTAGHVVMLAADPEVVRDANGKIIGAQSFVTVLDQTPTWKTAFNSQGQEYTYQANVDEKWSFDTLLKRYLPFTYAEWLGTDPIEDPQWSYGVEGESATLKDITKAKLTCNYHIYDLYFEVYDKWGSQVFKVAAHNKGPSQYEQKIGLSFTETNMVWGDKDNLVAGGEYTAKVYAQLGTGQRPTLWEGKLIVE